MNNSLSSSERDAARPEESRVNDFTFLYMMAEVVEGKRKRPTVAEILENVKRKKQAFCDRSWEWAKQDLHRVAGLDEGDIVYVRYEYQEISESASGEEDEGLRDAQIRLVWWPAHVRCLTIGTTCPRAEDFFIKRQKESPDEPFDESETLKDVVRDHPDATVWQLDYEAKLELAAESIPCIFLDSETLVHFHPEFGQARFRAAKDVKDQSEVADEEAVSGLYAASEIILDLARGELPSTLEAIASREICEHLKGTLRRFMRLAAEKGPRVVTMDTVWSFFRNEISGGPAGPDSTAQVTEDPETAPALEDQPFPCVDDEESSSSEEEL